MKPSTRRSGRGARWVGLVLLVLGTYGQARAAEPAGGVPQQLRQGLFTEVAMGAFLTSGGRAIGGGTFSAAEPYLQLGVGYDLHPRVAVALSFGLGNSADSCFAEVDVRGECVERASAPLSQRVAVADNFTLTMLVLEGIYKQPLGERLSLQPRLQVGWSVLDPEPREGGGAGATVGAGLGLEYATRMDHFTIGAEAFARYVVGPGVLGFAVMPRVKYTF